ncbi:aspartate aminotransferase family protein [Desulfosudis oleivorans]|uniref:Taurine--pyruvate aminotransferase n=1 Tax=Desulfosudis oleivorans (strain DSM 6200 / JCM 39069 / Hxd3) TaxID=96561 RepID=A8ZX23_DESOH|nr:aspartate aminotransferase family protein [Desulfosudis oleivorans]ABW66879.1 aminotransferase class-III [Desulfosudis oleivorans Hxd3]
MNQTSRKTISRKERNQVFDAFGKHISKGQIRYLTAGHLDVLEGERDGFRFYEGQSGKAYLDGFSSAGCFNVGRSNPQIIRKLEAAVDDYDMGTYGMLSAPKIKLAKLLADIAPGDLNRVLLCGTGADVVEGALKLARAATGRNEIISMLKAYHGHSGMSLSANGKDYYKELFLPLMPGFCFAPFGDLEAIRQMVSKRTAAIILEPIQGEGGIHVGTDEYLKGLRELCDQLGIMLVFDEIQTGFGRTGKLWASEHSGVVPDIMLLAKSIGGGVYPNAAILYRDRSELTDYVDRNPEFHLSMGGGSDLGCIVSTAVIEYIVENKVWENVAKMGNRLLEGLRSIQNENPGQILEVRGRGMMVGIEYKQEFMGMLMADCLATHGMFAAYSGNAPQVMRFQFPTAATAEDIDEALAVIRKAIKLSKLYMLALGPLSKIPFVREAMNKGDIMVTINNLLRKAAFWE